MMCLIGLCVSVLFCMSHLVAHVQSATPAAALAIGDTLNYLNQATGKFTPLACTKMPRPIISTENVGPATAYAIAYTDGTNVYLAGYKGASTTEFMVRARVVVPNGYTVKTILPSPTDTRILFTAFKNNIWELLEWTVQGAKGTVKSLMCNGCAGRPDSNVIQSDLMTPAIADTYSVYLVASRGDTVFYSNSSGFFAFELARSTGWAVQGMANEKVLKILPGGGDDSLWAITSGASGTSLFRIDLKTNATTSPFTPTGALPPALLLFWKQNITLLAFATNKLGAAIFVSGSTIAGAAQKGVIGFNQSSAAPNFVTILRCEGATCDPSTPNADKLDVIDTMEWTADDSLGYTVQVGADYQFRLVHVAPARVDVVALSTTLPITRLAYVMTLPVCSTATPTPTPTPTPKTKTKTKTVAKTTTKTKSKTMPKTTTRTKSKSTPKTRTKTPTPRAITPTPNPQPAPAPLAPRPVAPEAPHAAPAAPPVAPVSPTIPVTPAGPNLCEKATEKCMKTLFSNATSAPLQSLIKHYQASKCNVSHEPLWVCLRNTQPDGFMTVCANYLVPGRGVCPGTLPTGVNTTVALDADLVNNLKQMLCLDLACDPNAPVPGTPPPEKSNKNALYIGIAVAAVVTAVLMGGLIYFSSKKKKAAAAKALGANKMNGGMGAQQAMPRGGGPLNNRSFAETVQTDSQVDFFDTENGGGMDQEDAFTDNNGSGGSYDDYNDDGGYDDYGYDQTQTQN